MTKKVSVVIVTYIKDRKEDLLECLDSYLSSSYKNLEIIVVDNASKPPVLTWLPKKYKNIKLITSDTNLGAAEGRNRGLLASSGDYIIFTDDDAYCDREMVRNLVWAFEHSKDAGIVQPLVYDKQKKNVLQGAGHDINLTTGRIKAWGVREKDTGQYEGIREVPMCGCVWMVKRAVFKKIGNYDADYFIPYEDSDFSIRARMSGYKLYCYSKAKTYHQGLKKSFVNPRIEWLGITSVERAYRISRNKIIFMRKHSPFPNSLFFFFVLLPVYALSHSVIILSTGRFDILSMYWLGLGSGIFYALFFPFFGLRKVYKDFDAKLYPIKMFLMAWTDPIVWVIDKSSRTILDVGCGQGKPLLLIRMRMKVKEAVGVDLFKPYIEEAKKLKTHDRFILKDVRKINFKPRSFDVVLSSHVIEHMPKEDALKLLDKMEKIARRQIVIASPIGEMYHPAVDGNALQIHLSAFTPEDFKKRGYKVVNYGWSWLLGEEGIVHRVRNDFVRKLLYAVNILATPIYYLFPSTSDYTFVAYKYFSNEK